MVPLVKDVVGRVTTVLVLLVGLAACGRKEAAPAAGADDPAGKVIGVEGDVSARRAAPGATMRVLVRDAAVFSDDTVTTGPQGSVKILLHHNQVTWSLEAGQARRIDESLAWKAPRESGAGEGRAETDRTGAAGRHVEEEAAHTAATALAPAPAAAADERPRVEAAPPPARAAAAAEEAQRAAAEEQAAREREAAMARAEQAQAKSQRDAERAAAAEPPPKAQPREDRKSADVDKAASADPLQSFGSGEGKVGIGTGGGGGGAPGGGGPGGPGGPCGRSTSRQTPTVDMAVTDVGEGLDRGVVLRTVRAQLAGVRYCYLNALKSNPVLQGKLELRLLINAEGHVLTVAINQDSVGSTDLAACVSARLRLPSFPKPPAPAAATVRLGFIAN